MSELQERIVQFRKMANDDPENELGHFRLGQLLMEADDHDEAVKSLRRTLELSPQFSKVYSRLRRACSSWTGVTKRCVSFEKGSRWPTSAAITCRGTKWRECWDSWGKRCRSRRRRR